MREVFVVTLTDLSTLRVEVDEIFVNDHGDIVSKTDIPNGVTHKVVALNGQWAGYLPEWAHEELSNHIVGES